MCMTDSVVLKPGDSAPDFNLENQDGKVVSLGALVGKPFVIYFYPAAATPGCTTQACDFRDNLSSLSSAGYTVIGVSPDKPSKLRKFKEKESLNFDLLSDPDNSVQQAYGAFGKKSMYGKEYLGTIRSTFVVDASGKISHALYNVKAKGHLTLLKAELGLQ